MSEPKKLNYFEKKEQNKAHAQQVIRWASNNRRKEVQALSEATVLMPAPSAMPEGRVKFEKTEIEVMQCSTVDAIIRETERGARVCALNFASYKNPGGMFTDGSMAQEESLCHASILYPVLCSDRVRSLFYDRHKGNLNKALYLSDMLYTPDVPFWQGGVETKASIITCAAPNKKAAQTYQKVPDDLCKLAIEDRIAAVLHTADVNQEDTLILGAFGCGVFGNDVREVAEIFRDQLECAFRGTFQRVVFAVLDHPSYEIMASVYPAATHQEIEKEESGCCDMGTN